MGGGESTAEKKMDIDEDMQIREWKSTVGMRNEKQALKIKRITLPPPLPKTHHNPQPTPLGTYVG